MDEKNFVKLSEQDLENVSGGVKEGEHRVPEVCPKCGSSAFLQKADWYHIPGKYSNVCNVCYVAFYYNEDGSIAVEDFFG